MKRLLVFFLCATISFLSLFSQASSTAPQYQNGSLELSKRSVQNTEASEKKTKQENETTGKKTIRTIIINSANKIEYQTIKDKQEAPQKKKPHTDEKTSGMGSSLKRNDSSGGSSAEAPLTQHNEANTQSEAGKNKKEAAQNKTELIILSGDVSVSIEDGLSVNRIFADKIIYNKTRNMLHAEGNVRYERKVSGKLEQSFSGNLIVFDVNGMNGVFTEGVLENNSQKKTLPNYIIHSETTGRDESGVTAFKNAKLTTSSSKEPLWSITASRMWLLPGNEMSFANGYYSIGIVPIFYLPFFYHPADEMIFHPSFGFRSRVGYFAQTTTYLIGRKKLAANDSKTSFSNFMVSDTLKEQKRNGLFLQNLSEDAKIQDPSYLKIIADAYSSLGYLVGIDGDFSSAVKYFNTLNFNAYFGLSHTLYPLTANGKFFTMHNYNGETSFNEANFFGKAVPFRYSTDLNATIGKSPVSLRIRFPFVSDPYFKSDFFDRSEDMNWFKFMLNNGSEENKTKTFAQASYNWDIQFSTNPNTGILSPFLSFFNLQLSNNVLFNNRKNETLFGEEALYAPERNFYYPKKLNPKMQLAVKGTVFSTSLLDKKKSTHEAQDMGGITNPFLSDETVHDGTDSESKKNDKAKNDKNISNEAPAYIGTFMPLYTDKEKSKTASNKPLHYDLNYHADAEALHEGLWDEKKWLEPKHINWQDFSSHYYRVNYTVGLTSSLKVLANLLKVDNSFDFKQNYQRNPYIKDKTEQERIELNNFKANTIRLNNQNAITVSPFYFSELFSGTNIQWALSETLLQTKFSGTYQQPHYETEKVKWDKKYITLHNFSSTFAVNLNSYTQSLKLTAALPPRLSSYTMLASFQHPYGSLSADTKVFEKEQNQKTENNRRWFWSPFTMNAVWNLPYDIRGSQTYIYNIEDKKSDSFNFSFSWKYLSLRFLMQRDIPYRLDRLLGWQTVGTEKKFAPKSFECNFSNASEPLKLYFWKNRLQLSLVLKSTLNINMQKVTESFFTFEPSINFSIYEFLTLKIGTISRNDVIARYFQDSLNLGVTIPGEKNMLTDLLKSFYFWDTKARKESGFKIKSINIGLEHNLKDWTMNFSYSFTPELKYNKLNGRNEYRFISNISFTVMWNPINDIRVKTTTNDTEFKIERGSIR